MSHNTPSTLVHTPIRTLRVQPPTLADRLDAVRAAELAVGVTHAVVRLPWLHVRGDGQAARRQDVRRSRDGGASAGGVGVRTPLSVFVGSHLDADIAAVESEIRATDAPTGWLGPLLDGLMAARAVVAAAEDYSPELEAGDNGEWAFDEALVSLAQPYAGERGWDRQWLRSEATR